GWIHLLESPTIALPPMTNEVAIEQAGPAYAALKKCKVQFWKTARHSAHEDSLADGLERRGKVAYVIVGKIRRREPEAKTTRAAVKRRRYAKFDAPGPDGIVIVGTVQPEHIHSSRPAARFGMFAAHFGNRTRHRM